MEEHRASLNLTGQAAVVTGGNGGIGLAIADGLAAAGADVAVWARDQTKSATALAVLAATHPDRRIVAVTCDVSDPDDVDAATTQTVAELGRLDACVANAGIPGSADFLDLTPYEWRRVLDVNLDGAFFTLQSAARSMVAQGQGGALVAVSSTSATHGAPSNAHYAASKAGVLGLVRSAAVALARHRIRVNALIPGWTVTDMTKGGHENDRFRDATVARTPVRRWGRSEEFAAIATYLCDKAHEYHTGDAVTVDGGYTIF